MPRFLAATLLIAAACALIVLIGSARLRPTGSPAERGLAGSARPTACEQAALGFGGVRILANKTADYRVLAARTAPSSGVATTAITAAVAKPRGLADLYQTCAATPYEAGRVQVSAELKLVSSNAWGGSRCSSRTPRIA